MRLAPAQSPGRGTRKARDYGNEIVELRAQGYTLDAIRSALADAGVHVTISTVWREANRAKAPPPRKRDAKSSKTSVHSTNTTGAPPGMANAPPVASPVLAERPDGKKQAELFMSTQITNPLIRAKEKR